MTDPTDRHHSNRRDMSWCQVYLCGIGLQTLLSSVIFVEIVNLQNHVRNRIDNGNYTFEVRFRFVFYKDKMKR